MTDDELLDALLDALVPESREYRSVPRPADYAGKRSLLRAVMNTRPPLPVRPEVLELQDRLLSAERERRGVVDPLSLPSVKAQFGADHLPGADRLALWRGDITTLRADAIVNAANSKLLGCFTPLHNCIDNVIHSAAGLQLRLECHRIMQQESHDEPTGRAKITRGYNLPAKYVLHTVGPIIGDRVSREDARLLGSCYTACLDLAAEQAEIHTLAFCCISTGVFRFPKDQAAAIALEAVAGWLQVHPDRFERILFNVFTQEDAEAYAGLFSRGGLPPQID